ncbi:UNKNOWN [Stylonychia lemnae]|uniref:Uncharacterized protein n=1 Tax=Stylonychia lemnae TaxID=5949 RepID=A0A078AM40_STYLE|nr:UNKNOWN [Stylonychia lemnae]|eukprot:CDW83440.1 UNKNOWN [Stylonychia lemnae]
MASPKLEDQKVSSRDINVTFVFDSNGIQCPQIDLPPLVNMSMQSNTVPILPNYYLRCMRTGYYAKYQIAKVDWLIDLSNVSWILHSEQIDNANSNLTQTQISELSKKYFDMFFFLADYDTLALLHLTSRNYIEIGESIRINITVTLTSPEMEDQQKVIFLQTKLQKIASDFVLILKSNNNTFQYNYDETIFLNASGTYDPQDPGTVLDMYWTYCGDQNFNLQKTLLDDPSNILFNQSTLTFDLTQGNMPLNLTISKFLLDQMYQNDSTQYTLNAYMFYTDSSGKLLVYYKNVQIIKIDSNQQLIVQLKQTYQKIALKDPLVLDATQSYDSQNPKNRQFFYKWLCPSEYNISALCNTSKPSLNITQAIRTQQGINKPGFIIKIGVYIYNSARQSQIITSQTMIQPDSPTKECLAISQSSSSYTNQVDQYFKQPLIRPLNFTSYCQGIKITQMMSKIAALNQNNDIPTQILYYKSFQGQGSNNTVIDYNSLQSQDQTYNLNHQVFYTVNNDYQDVEVFQETLNILKYKSTIEFDQFFLEGPTTIDFDTDFSLLISLNSRNPNTNMQQLDIQWNCDSRLKIDSVCKSQRGTEFNLQRSDLKQY